MQLTVQELKDALNTNAKALKKALQVGSFQDIANLKVQRDELKNCLIDALETELKKVG